MCLSLVGTPAEPRQLMSPLLVRTVAFPQLLGLAGGTAHFVNAHELGERLVAAILVDAVYILL